MNEAETRAELIARDTQHWAEFVQASQARFDGKKGTTERSKLWAERNALFAKAANPSLPIDSVSWGILDEWGGMHGGNVNALKGAKDKEWLHTAQAVRCGKHDRHSAYDAFANLRANGLLPGMGPAYFTKLIYFLMPRQSNSHQPGYIMDQWAACSVNLLAGRQVVRMDCVQNWISKEGGLSLGSAYQVSSVNDADAYETYCRYIEAIASEIGRSADDAELLLMSRGGKEKDAWRKYVIRHRQPPHE